MLPRNSTFLPLIATLCRMEQPQGEQLARRRKARGFDTQEVFADAVGVSVRTIRNWESGRPISIDKRDVVAKLLGDDWYVPGDEVIGAIRRSELIEWRQGALVAEYQRHMHEQVSSGQQGA